MEISVNQMPVFSTQKSLIFFIQMDYAIHIDTASIKLPILYLEGCYKHFYKMMNFCP